MQTIFKDFLYKIIVFTLIVSILEFGLYTLIPERFITSSWPYIIIFFFGFTLFMHHHLLKATQGKPQKFIFTFMMFTTIKILLYLALILVYVLLNRADAVAFIMAFFVNYFLFTLFEIIAVLKFLQKEKTD